MCHSVLGLKKAESVHAAHCSLYSCSSTGSQPLIDGSLLDNLWGTTFQVSPSEPLFLGTYTELDFYHLSEKCRCHRQFRISKKLERGEQLMCVLFSFPSCSRALCNRADVVGDPSYASCADCVPRLSARLSEVRLRRVAAAVG